MIIREFEIKEFSQFIREVIREEVANMKPASEKGPELIRRKEARELLGGISNPTIISYEKRGLLTPKRIGGTILYNKAEILAHKK